MITYDELRLTPEYWTSKIQIELYNKVEEYMEKHKMNRSQLAEKLGVSKGYVSQVLAGDFDHRISKLVSLALEVGYYPNIEFEAIDCSVDVEELLLQTRNKLKSTGYAPYFAKKTHNDPDLLLKDVDPQGTDKKISA